MTSGLDEVTRPRSCHHPQPQELRERAWTDSPGAARLQTYWSWTSNLGLPDGEADQTAFAANFICEPLPTPSSERNCPREWPPCPGSPGGVGNQSLPLWNPNPTRLNSVLWTLLVVSVIRMWTSYNFYLLILSVCLQGFRDLSMFPRSNRFHLLYFC